MKHYFVDEPGVKELACDGGAHDNNIAICSDRLRLIEGFTDAGLYKAEAGVRFSPAMR